MTTQLTDEQIDAIVNAVTDANPTANCETWSRLIARSTIAADRAQRGPDELESLRAESEDRLQNCAALVAENERLRKDAERKPMTETEIVKCLVQAGCIGTVKMTFESGPYDITRPSIKADNLVREVEAFHGIGERP